MESWKERFYKEAKDTVRELFDEQNWTDEEFDEDSLKTAKGLGYWLEEFFDLYECATEEGSEERKKYSKGIRLIIRELENMD